MEANEHEEPPHKTTTEELVAFWSRMDARGQENLKRAFDEQSGRPEAAAQSNAAPMDECLAGVSLCNTHPQSSQVTLKGFPDYRAACGLDWWEVRASIEFDPVSHAGLMMELDQGKQTCQQLQIPESWVKLMGLEAFRIGRTGMGGQGEHYEYKIDCGGVDIGLSQRQHKESGQANLLIRLPGRECLLKGALEAYDHIKAFIGKLGAAFIWEKLSRVDVCLDVTSLNVRIFEPLIDRRQFITRAKCVAPYENAVGNEWTGFSVGKRPARLIVYDKIREQEKKADKLYMQGLIDRRWGGIIPDSATRLEFQLSRTWLKEHGVSSPEDFLERRAAIIDKLTSDWFRLTSEPIISDSKHQSRAEMHPLWESLRSAFEECLGATDRELIPLQRDLVNPTKLIRQALGCLRNAALQCGFVCFQFEDFLKVLLILVDKALPNKIQKEKFIKDYFYRQTEYAA